MPDIKNMSPRSGRILKEDNQVVNQADMLEAIYKALVVDKNVGLQVSGSSVDLRGKAANKPAASAALLGKTYWSVDTTPPVLEVCDGTKWVVI